MRNDAACFVMADQSKPQQKQRKANRSQLVHQEHVSKCVIRFQQFPLSPECSPLAQCHSRQLIPANLAIHLIRDARRVGQDHLIR